MSDATEDQPRSSTPINQGHPMNDASNQPFYIRIADPSVNPLQNITNAPRDHLIPKPPVAKVSPAAPQGPAPEMPTTTTVRDEVRIGSVVMKQTVFGTSSYAVDGKPEVRLGGDTDGFYRGLIAALKTAI